MITTQEILNPSYFKVIRVYERGLAYQLKRKGFDIIGTIGDEGITKSTQFTLYGDIRKLKRREKPYIEHFGQLKKKKEQLYGK